MGKNHLNLYLDHYAEAISKNIGKEISAFLSTQHDVDSYFDYCIVIPAYNESLKFLNKIKDSALSQNRLLIIAIVNQPDNDKDTDQNQQLWNGIRQTGKLISSTENYQLIAWLENKSSVLAIDCFTSNKKLPAKQGVGLARKVGCDLACQLIKSQRLNNEWIHTTDADTLLPDDYLLQTPKENHTSAAIYPFEHIGANESCITKATLIYEQALKYYVDGLHYASSPYAFQTLGSCIAFNAIFYAQARGFPKRSGGEDFYLLNKLAKLGKVKQLKKSKLKITSRLSNRAPFGTGPTVEKIMQLKKTRTPYHYYNPQVFIVLKQLLETFDMLFSYKQNFSLWLKTQPIETQEALESLKIENLFKHLGIQATGKTLCIEQAHDWFDGFRTLKFIHHLERRYPKVPLEEAIDIFYNNIN